MKKLILYGLNTLTKEVVRFSESDEAYEIALICVDRAYLKEASYRGIPVVAFEDLDQMDTEGCEMVITFGYSSMNRVKQEKYALCVEKGYKMTNFISSKASVYADVIGESNIIMPNTVISNGVRIGNCNTFYPGVVVGHDCVIGNFNFIASCVDILGMVTVGDRCFIGGNSTIVDAKTVANATLIGAGAVVSRDTAPEQVVVSPRSIVLDKKSSEFY